MNKSPFRKAIMILRDLLFILVAAVALNFILFNRQALFEGYDAETFTNAEHDFEVGTIDALAQLSAEEQRAIEVERDNARMLAEYNGEEYVIPEDSTLVEENGLMYRRVKQTTITFMLDQKRFIKKLALKVPVEESSGYTTRLLDHDGNIISEGMYCSISPKIGVGVTNVGERAEGIQIILMTGETPDLDSLSVTVSNDASMNLVRVLFLWICIFSIWLFIKNRKMFARKPQWAFALFAFLLGGVLIGGIGTNQVSYDEYVHAKSAYKLSFGATIETTEAAMQMVGNTLPFFNNPEERMLVEAYEDQMNDPDYIAPDIGHQSRLPRAETRVYYPMAAGFWLGRKLSVGFADMVALAKLGNLICYIAIVFWAVKKAKGYGTLVAGIGLLPNNIFIASALSYDALVTSCLLFGYVLALNAILEPDEKMKPVDTTLMLLAFVVGCLSKPVYIVMVLILLFLPGKKFQNRVMEIVFKGALCILAFFMIYNIFFPTPVAGGDYQLVSNAAYSGDKRNMGTSTTGQIQYILANPLAYTRTLLGEMFGMLGSYTIGRVPFVGYAYLGTAGFAVNWLMILLGIFAAVFANMKQKIGTMFTWMNNLMNFGVAAIVFSSMYISYTTVGSENILGVQGRYFIPLFLPFLSCFLGMTFGKSSKMVKVREKIQILRVKLNDERAIYGKIIFAVMTAVNLYMTWKLVILPLNV